MLRAPRPATPAALACLLSIALAGAALADDIDACHQAVTTRVAAIKKARIAQLSRCLKFASYDDCAINGVRIAAEENSLRNRVADDTGPCAAALAAGSVLADFGPTSCAPEWNDCDVAVPTIATLDDLAECLVCQQQGYDLRIRATLGWPRPAPTDRDELRCTRTLGILGAFAVRKAAVDLSRCARGGAKPFDCPVDDADGTRLAGGLLKIERKAPRCRIDEGAAPGALANLCGGMAGDQDGITACFTSLARCLACRTANAALDQNQDCATFSTDPTCTGT